MSPLCYQYILKKFTSFQLLQISWGKWTALNIQSSLQKETKAMAVKYQTWKLHKTRQLTCSHVAHAPCCYDVHEGPSVLCQNLL